jgi:hypothetical protein
MSRIPSGKLVWSLKRYTRNKNLWDRVCEECKRQTPVFVYEHQDEQKRTLFGYLCEECAQKKLREWLQSTRSPDDTHYQVSFDSATVFYEQKNDGETLLLTRWSSEQRRRRLQGEDE